MIWDVLRNKRKEGKAIGITSVCSANKFVIKASMIFAKKNNTKLLIESTSNQVDQFGGYTGMTPEMFKDYVISLAHETGFNEENLILGGDHLGPNVWKNLPSSQAMENAKEQIAAYAKAGYLKFHLDTSFVLGDDKTTGGKLNPELITLRAAELCETVEKNFRDEKNKPVYVIGTDVPIPGGAIENEEDFETTTAGELEETIELSKRAFYSRGLEEAWERVIAVVVQPGVEFSHTKILPYSRERNAGLINKINDFDNLFFEAHSTDYQMPDDLKKMVEDHFVILKVGPWLTFALREALFALYYIEREMFKNKKNYKYSNLIETVENEMKSNPQYWKNHYKNELGPENPDLFFSYSDRIRYYWTNATVNNSVNMLLQNLSQVEIPDTLISQFMPVQYNQIREGVTGKKPTDLINSKISEVLSVYHYATGGKI